MYNLIKESKIAHILALLLLAIVGITYFGKNPIKLGIVEIEEKRGISNETLFLKNRECVAEKQKIESEIAGNNTSDWQERLVEIFYAPKLNSCVYISEVETAKYWRILKRLVDYRSAAGSEPIESCEYPHPVLMSIAETNAKGHNDQMLLQTIEDDRNKPYELWCEKFDTEADRLKN